MVSSIAPLSLFFLFHPLLFLSLSPPFSLFPSLIHVRKSYAHTEKGMYRQNLCTHQFGSRKWRANYPITWNHRNHLIPRISLLDIYHQGRRNVGRAIPFEQDGGEDRYLGQGRSIALDTVALRVECN